MSHNENCWLASGALAIRVIFPPVGVIQVSFNLSGLPALLGKQKKGVSQTNALNFMLEHSIINEDEHSLLVGLFDPELQ